MYKQKTIIVTLQNDGYLLYNWFATGNTFVYQYYQLKKQTEYLETLDAL